MLFTETMAIGDKFINSIAITILGMVVVFIVLIIIAYSLELLRILFKDKPKESDEGIEVKKDETMDSPVIEVDYDNELVAVIAGAIAAYENTSSDNLIIRSIKEHHYDLNLWASVGRQQLMTSNYINKRSTRN